MSQTIGTFKGRWAVSLNSRTIALQDNTKIPSAFSVPILVYWVPHRSFSRKIENSFLVLPLYWHLTSLDNNNIRNKNIFTRMSTHAIRWGRTSSGCLAPWRTLPRSCGAGWGPRWTSTGTWPSCRTRSGCRTSGRGRAAKDMGCCNEVFAYNKSFTVIHMVTAYMGERGGMGGCPSPSVQNHIPTLEPKIRDLQFFFG